MKHMNRTAMAVALGASLILSAAGCSAADGAGSPSGQSPTEQSTTLSVALVGAVADGALHLGVAEGIFEEEGLEIEFSTVANPPAGIAAAQGGQVDLAYTPSIPLLVALNQGVDLTVVAPANGYPDGASEQDDLAQFDDAGLYAAGGSGIRSVEDLVGKTIAVPARKAQFEIVVTNELKKAGIGADEVEWVALDPASSVTALKSGTIDAATLFAPFAGQAAADGASLIAYPNVSFVEEGPLAYYVAGSKVVEQKADALAAFQRAILKVNAYANEHQEEATKAGLEAIDSPLPLEAVTQPYWPTELRPADLERADGKLVDLKVLPAPVDLDDRFLLQ